MKKYILRLGSTNSLDCDMPYFTNIKTRFNHTYIIGKSGAGKSALMERMADYDMKSGISVLFIDPKGDSVNKLTGNNHRYISFDNPIKINPLRKRGYDIDTLIREFTDVMDIMITATSINPETSVRMKEILAKAIKGFNNDDRNPRYLNMFLSFHDERKRYPFKDESIRRWFNEIEDTKKSGFKKASDYINTMSSIASRLSQFLDNANMSQFITDGENEFYLEDYLDKGQSLLINTNTSDLDNQRFLSALILHSVFTYIMDNRAKKPLMIYIDEFQSAVNTSFPTILQFARSCQVGFVLSHHDFMEISPKTLSSIFGISGNFIVFNCGDTEAERMASIVRRSKADIMDLPNFNAYARLGTSNAYFSTFKPLSDITRETAAKDPEEPDYFFLSDDWIMV